MPPHFQHFPVGLQKAIYFLLNFLEVGRVSMGIKEQHVKTLSQIKSQFEMGRDWETGKVNF